jgi:hypothetical protein
MAKVLRTTGFKMLLPSPPSKDEVRSGQISDIQ